MKRFLQFSSTLLFVVCAPTEVSSVGIQTAASQDGDMNIGFMDRTCRLLPELCSSKDDSEKRENTAAVDYEVTSIYMDVGVDKPQRIGDSESNRKDEILPCRLNPDLWSSADSFKERGNTFPQNDDIGNNREDEMLPCRLHPEISPSKDNLRELENTLAAAYGDNTRATGFSVDTSHRTGDSENHWKDEQLLPCRSHPELCTNWDNFQKPVNTLAAAYGAKTRTDLNPAESYRIGGAENNWKDAMRPCRMHPELCS